MDRFKRRALNFQPGVDTRQLRAQRRSIERRSIRHSVYNQQRADLVAVNEESPENTPAPTAAAKAPRLSRREMLERWKAEKSMKRKLEADKKALKPLFKVCRVENKPPSYLQPVATKLPARGRPAVSAVGFERRVTRAATAAASAAASMRAPSRRDVAVPQLKKGQSSKVVEHPEARISFAPNSFEFVPPVGLNDYSIRSPLSPESADSFLVSCFRPPSPPPAIIPKQVHENVAQCQATHVDNENQPNEVAFVAIADVIEPQASSAVDSEDVPLGIPHFRHLLMSNTTRLRHLCDEWSLALDTEDIQSANVAGRIRSVVGKANLLMGERFEQFSKLVDDCEFARGGKVTNCSDLLGFWEMILPQVKECIDKFQKLARIRANGFVDEETPIKVMTRAKRGPIKAGLKVGIGANKIDNGERSRAARLRMAEFKKTAAAELKRTLSDPQLDQLPPMAFLPSCENSAPDIEISVPVLSMEASRMKCDHDKGGKIKSSLCRTVLQRNTLIDDVSPSRLAANTPKNPRSYRSVNDVFSPLDNKLDTSLFGINGASSILSPHSPKLSRQSDLMRFSDVFSHDKENCGQSPLAKYITAAATNE